MKKLTKNIIQILSPLPGKTTLKFVAFIIVVALSTIAISMCMRDDDSNNGLKGRFEVTAVQVQKLKDIGQWEFLSISDEELIDTVRHGFFSDDQLTRLYYGTLRLGIDLSKTSDNWITTNHDTVMVVLPPIQLLDDNFMDEARTRAVFESGKWSETDKAMLTIRAKETMKAQCITQQNINSAEQNANTQFANLLHSMGFKWIKVSFQKPEKD